MKAANSPQIFHLLACLMNTVKGETLRKERQSTGCSGCITPIDAVSTVL